MFDCSIDMLTHFFEILPILIVTYFIFDFIGSFLFGKR